MNLLAITARTDLAAEMQSLFGQHGFDVDASASGLEGIRLVCSANYPLVIIDGHLPDLEGVRILECVLRISDVRVVFVASTDAVEDRVAALDAGAHDCLAHAVDVEELLARVRAVLRREPPKASSPLTVADLEINPMRRRVTRAGRQLSLTSKEYALLECLVRSSGKVLSRTLIRERVWDMSFDTHTIDVAVRRLRAKVDGPHEAKLIRTIRGGGYSLGA